MGFAKTENERLIVKEGEGKVDLSGPEGLLRAVFGYSSQDIHYPLPKILSTSSLPVKLTGSEFGAWITGFWEGDGSVWGRSLALCQKDIPMLLGISEKLECGYVTGYSMV